MNRFNVALIQMDSQQDKAVNIAKADKFIDEAVSKGADFITLPEMWTFITGKDGLVHGEDETIPGEVTNFLAAKAEAKNVWIHGGSMLQTIPNESKYYNTTVVYSPKGEIAAAYDKIHLFDVAVKGGVCCKESDIFEPGDKIVDFDTEYCKMGLAICYDIRFPELIRREALSGVDLFFVPAAWPKIRNHHWVTLNRARAIENQFYLAAVNQAGKSGDTEYAGESLLLDPWGEDICHLESDEEIAFGRVDTDVIQEVRSRINVFRDRRPDWDKVE